jgi:hypothetical protein
VDDVVTCKLKKQKSPPFCWVTKPVYQGLEEINVVSFSFSKLVGFELD